MRCVHKTKFGLFGSLFFVGVVLGSLILPRLSDMVGRKNVMFFGITLHLIPSAVILFTKNLNLALSMVFIMGFAMAGRNFVGYVYLTEHLME
jgi:MFS family permease